MQVNIGAKIRELRKRDGRRQDDLASALGVTAQAVSRWESNGCYPDMSMLPAIANYFHVSIDSLFGYNNDRDEKIKELTRKFNTFFIENDLYKTDLSGVIDELRGCLNEFPGEPELLRLLAIALAIHGEKESQKPNMYLEEAASILEKISEENSSVIFQLLNTYTSMGYIDKAEAKAAEQPSIQTCREILLASIRYEERKKSFNGVKERKYKGEAILTLLHELEFFINDAVAHNELLYNSPEGLEILDAVRTLYNKIFNKGDFGKFHSDMCMLNLSCAKMSARIGDLPSAYEYLDSAYEHFKNCEKQMEAGRKAGMTEDAYESVILKEAGTTSTPVIICRPEYITTIFKSFPENAQKEWLEKSQYASAFDKNGVIIG